MPTHPVPHRPDAADAGSGPLIVVIPHPDDESIFMSPWIHRAVRAGRPVYWLLLTDGAGNAQSMKDAVNRKLAADGLPPIDDAEWTQGRYRELRAAADLCGVPHEHLTYLGLPEGSTTRDQVRDAILSLLVRHSEAQVVTYSPADRHVDHRHAGRAAQELERAGQIPGGLVHVVHTLHWDLQEIEFGHPPLELSPTASEVALLHDLAHLAYGRWDPGEGFYAIGYLTGKAAFDTQLDPATRRDGFYRAR